MGVLGKKLRALEGGRLAFFCPGCQEYHMVQHGHGPGPRWGWNGSGDAPTFTPSILVKGTALSEKGRADLDAWQANGCPRREEPFDCSDAVCHSFITDGRIQFLGDCTHALAGQTVDLPNIERD